MLMVSAALKLFVFSMRRIGGTDVMAVYVNGINVVAANEKRRSSARRDGEVLERSRFVGG